jgi:hypothetical protein
VRLDTARRFALALPEVNEEPHFEKSSFRVRGKIFATVPLGGKHLHVLADPDETRALIADCPGAFEAIWWGKKVKSDWIRVNLASAETEQVRELLTDAWRLKAPKRLLATFDAQRAV